MAVTLKPNKIKIKDSNGEYSSPIVLADQTTEEHIAEVNAAIEQKGADTLERIPSDYITLYNKVIDMPKSLDTEEVSDLDVTDSNGNVLVRFENGHIQTKNFSSSTINTEISNIQDNLSGKQNTLTFDSVPTGNSTNPVTSQGIKSALDTITNNVNDIADDLLDTKNEINDLPSAITTEEDSDLDVTDSNGNVIVRFAAGHIQTKNFSSNNINNAITNLQINKQNSLTFDNTPTDNSVNPVTSGGVKSALDEVTSTVNEAIAEITDSPTTVATEESSDLDITDENGNVLVRFLDGHIQTKHFDSTNISGNSNVDVKDTDSVADLFFADNFGNVIAKIDNGHIVTKHFNSGNFTETLGDVATLKEDVSALKVTSTGILARNKDTLDGVYAACRWHQPSRSDKQFCLLMGGDIHADWPRMENMIEYLNAVDAFDAGIMLGDISDWLYTVTPYNDCIKNTERPFLTVLGNHDVCHGDKRYETLSELYAKYFANNIQYAELESGEHPEGACYYYKDFSDYGIRLIVMNQYEYPADKSGDTFVYEGGDVCYSQDQIDWFVDVLENTPSNYGVIIAGHTWFGRMTRDNSSILDASTVGAFSPHKHMDGYVVPEIVNAWINGQAYQRSYSYTPGGTWTTLTVDADFTTRGAGEFITYIGGHWHMSTLSTMTDYSDQHAYHVDCSGLPASTQGDTPRRVGTKSEDAICAMAVDRTTKKVKIFRIGAHFTMDGVDRQYGTYSYGT